MKIKICIFILICLCYNSILSAEIKSQSDSLLHIIQTTKSSNIKIQVYRNLADLYFEQPEERTCLREIYRIAQTCEDSANASQAIFELALSYIKVNKIDSAYHYMNILHRDVLTSQTPSYLSYLRLRLFDVKARNNKEELNDNTVNPNQTDIYSRIEQAYYIGFGLYIHHKHKEALPFLRKAVELAQELPEKEGHPFKLFLQWTYAHCCMYNGEKEKYIGMIEDLLQQLTNYYKIHYKSSRPFFPIDLYKLSYYSSLLNCVEALSPEKAQEYVQAIKEMKNITGISDKFNKSLALCQFYNYTKDYKNALIMNDSIAKYAAEITPSYLPSVLKIRADIYEALYDYPNALKCHKRFTQLKDSLTTLDTNKQLNELQVKYNVNKLNYENIQLENKNKQTIIISLSFITLIFTALSLFLYKVLKKERLMKKQLGELNIKAEESEKLKTIFINSMCHEIRTPLNAIVGFSGIIVDEEIDSESKKEYYDLITSNTQVLTSLIDHLLIVANLDSSEEMLPCEMEDIKSICQQQIEKIQHYGKKEIKYELILPEAQTIISTNERYLSLVIENLLDNANKFTEQGTITLKLAVDKVKHKLQITVTDTGCGIPVEKQEIIFQRFTKLDDFKQGNGLGLYLSRLILKRLSGQIYVDPHYIKGARFIIDLSI